MILLDDRAGSIEYHSILTTLFHTQGLVELARLPFADVAFLGNGPSGLVTVGIELKRISDVLQCIEDGRFAGHQLGGLISHFDYRWLFVEGQVRCDEETGVLQQFRLYQGKMRWCDVGYGNRTWSWKELDSWLGTMEIKTGIRVRRTLDHADTARQIVNLYHWWTSKTWDEHKADRQLHLAGVGGNGDEESPFSFSEPTMVRKMASMLPGIGWKKSAEVEKSFKTVREMVDADEAEWVRRKIKGVGKGLAGKIVRSLRGEHG